MPPAPLKDYRLIKQQARLWVKQVWPSGLNKVNRFYPNPGFGDPTCPATQSFEKGVSALGCIDTSSAEFAWHGTKTLTAVQNICWNNLNPQLRAGQSCGPGEYFSVDANVSAGYASSTGYIILCLLLKGAHNTTHGGGSVRVVNSPTGGSTMYCVPVGVVDYTAKQDPNLKGTAV
jgi:hypothetical protein